MINTGRRCGKKNFFNIALVFFSVLMFPALPVTAIQADEMFREIDVTRTLKQGQGAIPCETGQITWDGHQLSIRNTENGACMVPISTGKLENFRVTTKVSVSGGRNYHAAIHLNTGAATGSIFFKKFFAFGMMACEIFQSTGGNTKTIRSPALMQSTTNLDRFEITKVGKRHRFFINGQLFADWTDSISREFEVWFQLGSIVDPGQGVFQDFKVYKLEASDAAVRPSKEKPSAPPKKKDKPPEKEKIGEDEWKVF